MKIPLEYLDLLINLIMEFFEDNWNWKNDKLYDMIYSGYRNYNEFFSNQDVKQIISKISDQIYERAQTKTIYPPMEDCMRCLTTISKPVGIILGQDPYHNEGSATGLCFSLPKGLTKLNPSLKNIQKEVENNDFNVNQNSGDLTNWARQGILLLNSALTVESGNAGSHTEYWVEFTEKLLEYLTDKFDNLVIFLWGNDAQSFETNIRNKKNHYIIKNSHPSPFSANRGTAKSPAFIGSNCFKKANDYLISIGKKQINWNIY